MDSSNKNWFKVYLGAVLIGVPILYYFLIFSQGNVELSRERERESKNSASILEQRVTEYVDAHKLKGDFNLVAVYFEGNDGLSFGINEQEHFLGGSLYKVPILITYLKEAENNPGILDNKILYNKKLMDEVQYFQPLKEIEIGKEYTVKELLERMIIYSDNDAYALLENNISVQKTNHLFASLGLDLPSPDQPYSVSIAEYIKFFHALSNPSYLNKELSGKALGLLTKSEFREGLVAKIPNFQVAHKFGIRWINKN